MRGDARNPILNARLALAVRATDLTIADVFVLAIWLAFKGLRLAATLVESVQLAQERDGFQATFVGIFSVFSMKCA